MGKSTPKAPAAPDPVATAQAQTQSNVATAQTNAALNRVNEYTPYGSLVYSQPDPNNPNEWTSTQTLSPQEQANQDLTWQAQQLYGNTALSQLGKAAATLSTPMPTDYSAIRDQTLNAQMGLIQPQLDLQKQSLQAQLQDQGVTQGSDAWTAAMRSQTNNQNQMYAQILSSLPNVTGAAIQQQESLRDQPLNEAAALLTGQQVNPGQFQPVPSTQVAPTNTMDATQLQQSALWNQYNAQVQTNSANLGGAAGLVGSLGGAAIIAI